MGRKPGVPHRTKLQIACDRQEIARRHLQGEYQADIGKALGLTQQMISYELKCIEKAWLNESIRNFDEARAQELAKIDLLEQTYWERWENSKKEVRRRTSVIRPGTEKDSQPEPQLLTVRTDETTGDKRWLEGIQWCIERRCAIKGLNAIKNLNAPDGTETRPSIGIYRLPKEY